MSTGRDEQHPRESGSEPETSSNTSADETQPSVYESRAARALRRVAERGLSPSGILGIAIVIIALIGFAITGVYVFLPFLTPIFLALIFVSETYPAYDWTLARVGSGRRGLASTLLCSAWILAGLIPLLWIVWILSGEARVVVGRVSSFARAATSKDAMRFLSEGRFHPEYSELLRRALVHLRDPEATDANPKSTEPPPDGELPQIETPPLAPSARPDDSGAGDSESRPEAPNGATAPGDAAASDSAASSLPEEAPAIGPVLEDPAEIETDSSGPPIGSITQFTSWTAGAIAALLRGAIGFVIQFVIFFCVVYYFYRDGPQIRRSIQDAILVPPDVETLVAETFRRVSRSLVRGTLFTAVIQGVLATTAFLIVGLPGSLFWGALATLAALIPAIGTALITVPVALSYAVDGLFWWQGLFLIIAAVVISSADNILRPFFMERGLRLHPLWILLSILGGVSAFGATGIFIGPMVVIYLGTFLAIVGSIRPRRRADAASDARAESSTT
jgi:predicted PurR-regulated permease PerM